MPWITFLEWEAHRSETHAKEVGREKLKKNGDSGRRRKPEIELERRERRRRTRSGNSRRWLRTVVL